MGETKSFWCKFGEYFLTELIKIIFIVFIIIWVAIILGV